MDNHLPSDYPHKADQRLSILVEDHYQGTQQRRKAREQQGIEASS